MCLAVRSVFSQDHEAVASLEVPFFILDEFGHKNLNSFAVSALKHNGYTSYRMPVVLIDDRCEDG